MATPGAVPERTPSASSNAGLERMPEARAFALGVYLIVSFLVQICFLVALWPKVQGGKWEPTWDCRIFKDGCLISDDARLIAIVLHALRSFSAHIGARRLSKGWAWWYVLRPFEGSVIGLTFYLVLRGGLLSTNASTDSGAGTISVYGVAGIAVLVGMFSHEAVAKLKELAETLFSKPSQGTAGAAGAQPQPKPSVIGCDPSEIKLGTHPAQITVQGSNFVERSEVHIDGTSRQTTFKSASELEALLSEEDTKNADRSLKITVFTKPPGGGESQEDVKIRVAPGG